MPNPLRRLAAGVRDAKARHDERNRPTGFEFAIADRIDALNPAQWDPLADRSTIFLGRSYLRVLEANAPEGTSPRYALISRNGRPVAALAAQVLELSGSRLVGGASKTARTGIVAKLAPAARAARGAAAARIDARILVLGNFLSWGFHGAAFADGEDPAALWPAVSEALYRIRQADRLSGDTDFVLVKDVTPVERAGAETLRRFSYRPIETDPNMVLELRPEWRGYDDYLGALAAKYRRGAKDLDAKVEAAGGRVEPLADVPAHADRLHALYRHVHEKAAVRPVTMPASYLPAVAAALGDRFRCTVIRRDDELVGFVTTVADGETAVGYFIGYDPAAAAEMPIYLRLLRATIADAIALGCRRLSLGRTALEPKAALGAKPEPFQIWMRHRNPAVNSVVRKLFAAVPHDLPPERNPLK